MGNARVQVFSRCLLSMVLAPWLCAIGCTTDDESSAGDAAPQGMSDGSVSDLDDAGLSGDADASALTEGALPPGCGGKPATSDTSARKPDLVTRSSDDELPSSLYNSGSPDITPDGRFVVFESSETNLVTPATNGVSQIFLRDRKAGTTELISVNSSKQQGNKASNRPSISDDGCLVAFQSLADNLVDTANGATDSNAASDVFVRDRCVIHPGTPTLVSVDAAGSPLLYSSNSADLSGDGSWVAFESNTSSGNGEIYLIDITVDPASSTRIAHGDFSSRSPAISRDGRRVAFWSYASDLVAGDGNGMWDIFLYDQKASPRLLIVSSDADGVQQTQGSEGISTLTEPAISADGRYVAFRSRTTSLLPVNADGFSQVYVKDMSTGKLLLASQSSDGVLGDADSSGSGSGLRPTLSETGTWVAFVTSAENLAPATSGAAPSVVAHNIETGETVGFPTTTADATPALSGDTHGRFLAMYSTASLDPRFDSSGVFVLDRNTPPVADAGEAQRVKVGDTVQLDGSASQDPDDFVAGEFKLSWRQLCGLGAVTFSDPHADKPTFVAPGAGAYVLELVANDGIEDSAPSRVTVTVTAP